ncbi:MAG TPA: 6-bladed beta-propeller [Gemmatimonadota bacterium]|nr:6-bladed beta-propeller [Gemmatimonadota bacterium]
MTASRLAAAAAALLLACRGGDGAGREAAGAPARPAGRVVVAHAWEEAFRVGGSLEDTLLQGPARLAADARGVWVADPMAGRILRFDHEGRLVRAVGRRGGGPGEFRSMRDLEADPDGRAWVLDRADARVTILDPAGGPGRRIPLGEEARSADQLVPLAPDRGAVLVVYDRERPFVRVGPDGRIEDRFGTPWSGFADLDPLAAQLVTAAGSGGRWAALFGMGDGFFVRGPGGWSGGRKPYVEEVAFPRVETRGGLSPDGTGRVEERIAGDRPVFAALSASAAGGRLAVLFGGRSPERGRWLDVYDLADGSYRGSLLLPGPFEQVALGGGLLYGLAARPAPVLVAYRLPTEGLP